MADETLKYAKPDSFDATEFEVEDPDRTAINRGRDADFIVKSNVLGGAIEYQLRRGDRISKADLANLQCVAPADFKRLIDNKAIVPLRDVEVGTLAEKKVK